MRFTDSSTLALLMPPHLTASYRASAASICLSRWWHRSAMSAPASIACTIASSEDETFAIAPIYKSSVTMIPLKPNRSLINPVSTRCDSVAGIPYSGSIAGYTTWAVMTASSPAFIAAIKGTNSVCSRCFMEWGTTGRSICESIVTFPLPGQCFAVATTPVSRYAPIAVTPSFVTSSTSSPYDRTPMPGLSGLLLISNTGARFMFMPSAIISLAITCAARLVYFSDFAAVVAPKAMFPGNTVAPLVSRVTTPPSWSIAIWNPTGHLRDAAICCR